MADTTERARIADEMGAALGPGWARVTAPHLPYPLTWATFVRGRVGVLQNGSGWAVALAWPLPLDGTRMLWPPSAEATVAVAHLLVAAEQVANGAEVAEGTRHFKVGQARLPEDREHGRCLGIGAGWYEWSCTPAEVRRFALDLLRAAEEADRG